MKYGKSRKLGWLTLPGVDMSYGCSDICNIAYKYFSNKNKGVVCFASDSNMSVYVTNKPFALANEAEMKKLLENGRLMIRNYTKLEEYASELDEFLCDGNNIDLEISPSIIPGTNRYVVTPNDINDEADYQEFLDKMKEVGFSGAEIKEIQETFKDYLKEYCKAQDC